MVDANAEPVPLHTTIPAPLQWQSDVKAGLDHDVSLSILELVPVGEPVTWCHHMVIWAKKNGKPKRTVDFQALSLHATRGTHHTLSPLMALRRLLLTVGTATTVFPFTQTTATSPPSLSHRDDTDTKQHPRGTLHQVMATPEDLMRLSLIPLTRPMHTSLGRQSHQELLPSS